MRASVLALDLLVYIPAVVWFTRLWWTSRSRRTQVRRFLQSDSRDTNHIPIQNIALLTILLQPALTLIDNGHFQLVLHQGVALHGSA